MSAGSFYYDQSKKNLYLTPVDGTLAGKTVEVSVRQFLVHGYDVHNYTLKNLTFTHSNSTAFGQTGALRMHGGGITLDNVKVMDCDGTGITIRGDNNVIKNSLFTRCGQFGVTGSGKNVKWLNNEITHNNTRGFYKEWGAGGMKFMAASPLGGVSGLHDSEFVGNRVLFNKGDGIWFDSNNRNNLIANNTVAYNAGSGIHYEISYGGVIRNNYVFGNTQRGIYVANSADTVVEHNLVACNGLEGVYAQNAEKRAAIHPARNNKVNANIIAWSGKHAVRLPSANYNNVSDNNLIVGPSPQYGVWDDVSNPT
ncbi:MAG: right-handed parallel beta-helix repeat-containing protein, partial [Pyrinomonadaceae bacterium]